MVKPEERDVPRNGWWNFGASLMKIRKELKLTQEVVAEILGVNQSTLSRLEQKVNSPWKPGQAEHYLVTAKKTNLEYAKRLKELLKHCGYSPEWIEEIFAEPVTYL